MFKWLSLPGSFSKKKETSEGLRAEPKLVSLSDREYVKKLDAIVDSLNKPVSNLAPDFTLLEPAVLRSDDKWTQAEYKKILLDFLGCYRRGWFSVCIINDVAKVFNVSTLDSARLSSIHDQLKSIHCCHWKHLDPEIMKEIPGLLNEAFRIIEHIAYYEHEYYSNRTYEGSVDKYCIVANIFKEKE